LIRWSRLAAPNNPVYPYLQARAFSPSIFVLFGPNPSKTPGNTDPRVLLEAALRIDADYLPALYAYVMSKAEFEQRMGGLAWLAAKDPDNAEPYYLMAFEQFTALSKGREVTEASDKEAFELSPQEWQSICDLIGKGNRCRTFEWRTARAPSTRDIQISTRGRLWPAQAAASYCEESNLGGTADSRYDPHAMLSGAVARQLARQAKWAARAASKSGDDAKALRYLTVIMDFGSKYSLCEPLRMLPFLVGDAIWAISEREAENVLKKTGDKTALEKLTAQKLARKAACKQLMPLMNKYVVHVNDIRVSKTDRLFYNDPAIEEAGMGKILAGLKHPGP
jgi:hypothetical protein